MWFSYDDYNEVWLYSDAKSNTLSQNKIFSNHIVYNDSEVRESQK